MKWAPLCSSLAFLWAAFPAVAGDANAVSHSSSRSSSSSTDGNGNTVTITTTERDGKRETRRTVTAPNGRVLSDTTGEGAPAAQPAADASKPGGPWLGVHTAEVPPALREQLELAPAEGVLVEQLAADSPAARAGIAQHDILLTFHGMPVATPEQLRAELAPCQPGQKVLVEYLRKARREKVEVTLGKRAGPEAPNLMPPVGGGQVKIARPGPGGSAQASAQSSTRTVIVGSDGKTQVIESNGNGDPFAEALRDPNVPAAMKDSLRKMQEQMRDFQKRAKDIAPGIGKGGD